jgi:hypothetical protein
MVLYAVIVQRRKMVLIDVVSQSDDRGTLGHITFAIADILVPGRDDLSAEGGRGMCWRILGQTMLNRIAPEAHSRGTDRYRDRATGSVDQRYWKSALYAQNLACYVTKLARLGGYLARSGIRCPASSSFGAAYPNSRTALRRLLHTIEQTVQPRCYLEIWHSLGATAKSGSESRIHPGNIRGDWSKAVEIRPAIFRNSELAERGLPSPGTLEGERHHLDHAGDTLSSIRVSWTVD